MPRISVIVPIYNVAPYLTACLRSIADQSFEDLEVIVVDDGSTDESRAIAEAFCQTDARFRVIAQPNGGLGNARNTGTDAAGGEFLAYVDGDDVLPRHAYRLLIDSLDRTGSDFATGNVYRMLGRDSRQAPFVAKAFTRTRRATHITKFGALIVDRIVPNKLWRRSFWDAQGFRHPEGMLHEDIPVVLPAHFAAKSVDVIADPVYLYRVRHGEDQSITQRRIEPRALRDRVTAVEHVSQYLRGHGPRGWKQRYDHSVVAEDLRYYVNVLDDADEEYRALFLDKVNEYLDGVSEKVFRPLPAIERLKWHLIRRRLMPELIEVLHFQRDRLADAEPVGEGGKWYGDYPFRTDERLRIPRSVYRLDGELRLKAELDGLSVEDGKLVVEGTAFIERIGAPGPGSQHVTVTAVPRGRRVLGRPLPGFRFHTESVERPGATAASRQRLADLSLAGFRATLRPHRLVALGRLRSTSWDVTVTVRAGNIKRRTAKLTAGRLRPPRAARLPTGGGAAVRAVPLVGGGVVVEARKQWADVRDQRLLDADVLELSGRLTLSGAGLRLVAERRVDEHVLDLAFERDRANGTFTVRVPLRELRDAPPPATRDDLEDDDSDVWNLVVAVGDGQQPVLWDEGMSAATFTVGDRELRLFRTKKGDVAIASRGPRPVATELDWTADGALAVAGTMPAGLRADELLISARNHDEAYPFRIEHEDGGRFRARLTPAQLASPFGARPLREGTWDLLARRGGERPAPLTLAPELYDRLPATTAVDRKPFAVGSTRDDRAVLFVERDLDDHERGPFNQRRLRERVYVAQRADPLRDAVVYTSFGGRQVSDSPRAIFSELVRRDAPVEHLWVVRDGMAQVPAPAAAVREGSREHHEALARGRFVVANDTFPDWFRRRDDQLAVQTWHGTPLKRLGLDAPETRRKMRKLERRWGQQVANWQYVLSPNRFTTPLLRGAYGIGGEILETGYPRDDLLAAPEREARSAAVRELLDVPDGVRTVLYAPTYRDNAPDGRGRYRLDMHLDLDRLHAALGPDTVLLLRKHHNVVDQLPVGSNGFVRDVSAYPDGTELLLAADVLVTDYSSLMFDYANTGRPMLFFAYDLDSYRDVIRGFYLDFEAEAPGPIVRTTDELADALGDLGAVSAAHAERYERFAAKYCELDDGGAAARVVDRLFPW